MQAPPGEEAAFEDGRRRAMAARRRIRNFTFQKEIGDDWVGELSESAETPPLDQVDHIYLLLGYKDRMLTVRLTDEELLEIPTLTVDAAARDTSAAGGPAKQLGRWLKPVLKGQWGIHLKNWTQHGRFEMTATPENTDVEPGSMRYHLFLIGTARKLEDLPEDTAWARRAIPRRDLVKLIETRYTEFDVVLNSGHERYIIELAKG